TRRSTSAASWTCSWTCSPTSWPTTTAAPTAPRGGEAMPVELAGITLAHLTGIGTGERARSVRHPVPGMSGDLLQTLGRPSADLVLRGAFFGPTAAADLQALRDAYRAVQPVDVVVQAVDDSDLVQTLGFSQVLITDLRIAQRAGLPDQFDYTCTLVEYVEPPQP